MPSASSAIPPPRREGNGWTPWQVILANRTYAARAGLDDRAVIGRPYWEVFPSRRLHSCANTMETGLAAEEVTLDDGTVFAARAFVVHHEAGAYYLRHTRNGVSHAAQELCSSRVTLYRLMEKYGIGTYET